MATARVENPDKIKCTLTFTMTLEDWRQIRRTLRKNAAYTEIQMMNEISDLILQLEKTYYVSESAINQHNEG